jgi:hypothetical protein
VRPLNITSSDHQKKQQLFFLAVTTQRRCEEAGEKAARAGQMERDARAGRMERDARAGRVRCGASPDGRSPRLSRSHRPLSHREDATSHRLRGLPHVYPVYKSRISDEYGGLTDE